MVHPIDGNPIDSSLAPTVDRELTVGDRVEASIDRQNSQGEGKGAVNGLAVFVPGLLPGEKAEVQVTKVARNFARGSAVRLKAESSGRVKPRCPVHTAPGSGGFFDSTSSCGGCQLQIQSREEELAFKRNLVHENLVRVGGLEVDVAPVVAGNPWGYRNKMAFTLTNRENALWWGLRSLEGADMVTRIPGCDIAKPELWRLCERILEALNGEFGPSLSWNGETGIVRSVMVRTLSGRQGAPQGEMDRAETGPSSSATFAVCATDIGSMDRISGCLSGIESIRVFFSYSDPRASNVYFDRTRFLNRLPGHAPFWGESQVPEEHAAWHSLGGWSTLTGPMNFLQVNDEMAERLYRYVLDLPFEGEGLAVDAYCGLGVLTRALSDRFEEVMGIELDSQAIKFARTTSRRLSDCGVEWVSEPAESLFSEWRRNVVTTRRPSPDLVILDPPRKGCQKEVLRALIDLRPKDVVYISCHPAALARDLNLLCRRAFQAASVQSFDFFPQTHHVETVVHLKS